MSSHHLPSLAIFRVGQCQRGRFTMPAFLKSHYRYETLLRSLPRRPGKARLWSNGESGFISRRSKFSDGKACQRDRADTNLGDYGLYTVGALMIPSSNLSLPSCPQWLKMSGLERMPFPCAASSWFKKGKFGHCGAGVEAATCNTSLTYSSARLSLGCSWKRSK